MRYFVAVLVTLAVLMPPFAVVRASDLEIGEWTGTATDPGEALQDGEPVTFVVGEADGRTTIRVKIPPDLSFDLRDVNVADDHITFTFNDFDCRLDQREDGSYAGDCTNEQGESGHLTMVPPE